MYCFTMGSIMSLRISSGLFKGRPLKTPPSTITRPTSERLRAALFNILGSHIEKGPFIDLCSGSGAMGLEALSRGAPHAIFVENHPAAFSVIKANIGLFNVEDKIALFHENALEGGRWLAKLPSFPAAFYFDPPYERHQSEHEKVAALLTKIGRHLLQIGCREKCYFFWEHSKHYPLSAAEKKALTKEGLWDILPCRTYGDAILDTFSLVQNRSDGAH